MKEIQYPKAAPAEGQALEHAQLKDPAASVREAYRAAGKILGLLSSLLQATDVGDPEAYRREFGNLKLMRDAHQIDRQWAQVRRIVLDAVCNGGRPAYWRGFAYTTALEAIWGVASWLVYPGSDKAASRKFGKLDALSLREKGVELELEYTAVALGAGGSISEAVVSSLASEGSTTQYSRPMSRTELLRRIFDDHGARIRGKEDFLKRAGAVRVSCNKWKVDLFAPNIDAAARKRLMKGP